TETFLSLDETLLLMDTLSKFPLYLPGRQSETNNRLSFISSDIRQEKTLLAHCTTDNGQVILEHEKYYPTKSYDSFSEIVLQFMKDTGISEFSRIAVGTPGPVINGQCVSIRLPWMLDAEKIKTETGINLVYQRNDVEATAYGLADFCYESLTTAYESETPTTGNVAILAPGEGLGEAGLYYDGTHLRPFATEGGHSEFSPRTNIEVEFYQFLNQIYGIVSWENVLSKN